ncbi:MAG: D-glucuronyl C5-epimerase family protein, partial [Armatimonadota bacterium]|nr:D-glucuronyl C5-epimerase family protein [Armatimonadota bacterium]
MDFSRDADYKGPFDNEGIPLIDYGGLIGQRYNPWAVCHYALANFQKYIQTKNKIYYTQFLKCSNWLIDHAKYCHNGSAIWIYDFSLVGNHNKPWISALAQSYAISVLLRAFLLTEEEKFLETAEKAFIPFTLSISEGGVQTIDSEGNIFFEEDTSLRIPYILNGFLFSLFGLYEF